MHFLEWHAIKNLYHYNSGQSIVPKYVVANYINSSLLMAAAELVDNIWSVASSSCLGDYEGRAYSELDNN